MICRRKTEIINSLSGFNDIQKQKIQLSVFVSVFMN